MSGSTAGKKRSKNGNLEKFSSKRVLKIFKPSWEMYHFQLVGGVYLQYFHKGMTTKPHKQIYLSEITRLELLDNWSDRQFCFRVCFTDSGGMRAGEIMWTLAARSDKERSEWMEAIQPGSSASSMGRMNPGQEPPAGGPTPPSPHRMTTLEEPSVGQHRHHQALAQRQSLGIIPPSYASTPSNYPPISPHQVEQMEGPIPPLSAHDLGRGNQVGIDDRSLIQPHYSFAVFDEMGLERDPSSLPGLAARQSALCPEGNSRECPPSPSVYAVMTSPSKEELQSMREDLRVMRSQSLSIHSSRDSGRSSPGRHYSVPTNLSFPQTSGNSSFKEASALPSSNRERMQVSTLDSEHTAELNPQLESSAGLPTVNDHPYTVLEEDPEYEPPTPLEVMKGLAFLEVAPKMERGPLCLLSAADEAEFQDTFSNALVSHRDITIGREIGEGAFGRVYQGIVGEQKQEVAIKTIRECDGKDELVGFLKESALMKDFDHPNVLGLAGVCLDNPTREPLILLPFMANGDLKSYLRNKREGSNDASTFPEGLDEQRLLVICEQIASGMAYLEKRHFVHRDLAARNCMMDGDMRVKVADFGMARDMHSADYYRLSHKSRLPVKWMAPESFYDGKFTSKTDVWSFGVTCWEVFSLGRTPYPGVEAFVIPKFLDSGNRMEKPFLCPESFYQLLLRCWDSSFSSRPCFSALVAEIEDILEGSNYMNFSVHQDQ